MEQGTPKILGLLNKDVEDGLLHHNKHSVRKSIGHFRIRSCNQAPARPAAGVEKDMTGSVELEDKKNNQKLVRCMLYNFGRMRPDI